MSNSEYWIKRFEQLELLLIKNDNLYVETLKEEYDKALVSIEKEVNNWFTRFAVNNQVSLKEAKRLLNTKELKELQWDIQEYIKHGQENGIDLIWRKQLENASAKVHISRLEALKLQIQQQIENLGYNTAQTTEDFIIDTYKNTYYRTAYEMQKGNNSAFIIQALDTNTIKKLISKPWAPDELTFSDRIWRNKKELINSLQTDLTQCIIRGDSPDKLIEKISKEFKTSKNKAARLVMTESAFFGSASRKDCFNDLGVEKYEIVATLDSHTSETCKELDGKVYNMKDYQPGITAPPFHVWCRSTTAPYFEDEFEFSERAARNTNGKTYYIPSNMKYNEWYDKYVSNNLELNKIQKTAKINSDKAKTYNEKIKELQNMMLDMNEARRQHWNLNIVSKDELQNSQFLDMTFSVDLTNIDGKVIDSIIENYKKLGNEYYTTLNHIGIFDDMDLSARPNSGGYAYIAPTTLTGEIHFNQTILNDYDDYVDIMKNASQIKHISPNINPENYQFYVSTHEFAHTLYTSSMLEKNLIDMDVNIYKNFQKELEIQFNEYKNKLKDIDKEITLLNKKFVLDIDNFTSEDKNLLKNLENERNEIFVSNYAIRDNKEDEFMAECFADAKLSDRPSKTSIEMMKIIDKYFKR